MRGRIPLPLVAGCLLAAAHSPAPAQWLTQDVPLHAGWNAVYLHVQPHPASCDAQLAGLPVTEVHRYYQRLRIAQFDTDPAKPFPRPAEWLTWRPDDGTNGFVRTLDALTGDTAYLIRATEPVTLRLRGRPVLPRREWVPGIPNLVGFPIDPTPGAQATFADFFASEPRIPIVGGPTEGLIHEVDENLNSIDLTSRSRRLTMAPGRAYWVRPTGPTRFVGPLEVRTADPQGLFFGDSLHELALYLRNASSSPLTVTLRHVDSETPPAGAPPRVAAAPLLRSDGTPRRLDRTPWPVGEAITQTLAPGEERTLHLTLDRGAMSQPTDPSATWQSHIRLNAAGLQLHVPVGAAISSTGPQSAPYPAGLWVGDALITAVSYIVVGTNAASGETASEPLPVAQPFPLRLILHQNSSNVCQLLSQVVLGSPTTNGTASNVVVSLRTGNAAIPQHGYLALARLTSPALGGAGVVTLTGAGGGGFLKEPLTGTFSLSTNHPLNPFRHLYHPQHAQGIAITNTLTLDWLSSTTATNPPASLWNPDETVLGTLHQTITGLRHEPIEMQGAFRLTRVSTIATLDDSP